MTKYQLTFLLNEESELKNLKKFIESHSGKIEKEESWGEKTLAYPIKKNTTARFYNWHVELDGAKIQELKKQFNFNDKLLRYLLLKVE